MLRPFFFNTACRALKFKPSVDLFANAAHHQVPSYFTLDLHDRNAAGVNAFSVSWAAEASPYINPPWVLIPQVLQKLIAEKVTAMVVIPSWCNAPWYELCEKLCVSDVEVNYAVYIDNAGNLRPKPWWNTRFGILNGSLA